MSRYIDIDKQVYCGIDGDYERYNIDPNAPSIDIVRCKECRYWSGCKGTMYNHRCRRAEEHNLDYWTRADDFCSWGERKEP